jgi:predicted nucleotidyltransferase
MNSKRIAFALDFTSFLIQKTKHRERIRNVILFGSVAREEANNGSEVDVFIDIIKDDKKVELELAKVRQDFMNSTKYKNYWKPLGIENEIKLTVGSFDTWEKLKPSLVANGITWFGKFKPNIQEGEHKVFLVWENIKPNSTRVSFNKQLLGYRQKEKFYDGLLQKYNGKRLGKGCIFVRLEHGAIFLKLFKKYKAAVKIKKVLEY